MARLLDCFSALLSFGLGLDASIAGGRVGASCEEAQRRAMELLDEARAAAQRLGKPTDQIESALFAMVAWIDEVLSRHPGCEAAVAPLQMRLFNSSNAQTEFFHHLSALPAEEQEVREVYWHALALGFKGQYYFESTDDGELGKLKDLHAQQLAIRPASLDSLAEDRITPQPYGVPDPPGPRDPQGRKRALLRTVAALAAVLPLAYLATHLLTNSRETPLTLVQRVEQQVQTYACADLSATQTPEGGIRVSGYVPTAVDVMRVQREVRSLPGVTQASFDLRLRVWPHCEVVEILKPYQGRNRELGHGLKIEATSARKGQLREGDPVLFRVTGPNYDGYLWVDYYTADGAVMHLKAGRGQPRVSAGDTVELGRDIPSSWLVAPPFGTVLLAALSSPVPFSEATERPPFELASAYLQRLRESLAAGEFGVRVIADTLFLETVPR
ncbi:DotU family type IV/VI secretion system protein [Variovorax sp. Sphag1AA]|uniref:DotU family type IV/VI secretion system protein n=1 Tax=Variovorax sp. Sphag1AA TaxID=2587027 RepID=UPI00161FDAD0|nr:DotU family type IV/VI secretion system protein [Variovorax sp. Sphag1AA]MBB3180788.1 type IV/VI secretion system ImpK/VasF family protein [Variovorax sp. Sphag1AA]